MTNFFQVAKIWADENLMPTKIKGHFINLLKREVTNFLSICTQKFTVFIWVKFKSGKKSKKSFFLKRDILKKKNNLARIKNYSLNGFSIVSEISSAFCTASDIPAELNPLTYHLFFLYHIIIPIKNPSRMYKFQFR